VATELASARSLGNQHHVKHDPDTIGVVINQKASPCRTWSAIAADAIETLGGWREMTWPQPNRLWVTPT